MAELPDHTSFAWYIHIWDGKAAIQAAPLATDI